MVRPKNSVALTLVLLVSLLIFASGCAQKVQRYGMVIGIEKKNIPEYKRLHANTWPGVLKMIKKCNIRNYSIYLGEVEKDKFYLFSYFEYIGDDFEADMAKMAEDKTTQQWWKHTDPLQVRLPGTPDGEQWKAIEEVFHTD